MSWLSGWSSVDVKITGMKIRVRSMSGKAKAAIAATVGIWISKNIPVFVATVCSRLNIDPEVGNSIGKRLAEDLIEELDRQLEKI